MALLVLKLFRLLGGLIIFAITSKLYYFIFGDAAIISADTARKVAYFLNERPAPEDVYDVFDYAVISVNIMFSTVVYSLIVSFFPSKELADKRVIHHCSVVAKGVAGRTLKIVSVIGLFVLFLSIVDYDRFIPPEARYNLALAGGITGVLTMSTYLLLKYIFCRLTKR